MWWMMGEGGGHYCSKKTDDICGDVCGQVSIFPLFFFYLSIYPKLFSASCRRYDLLVSFFF